MEYRIGKENLLMELRGWNLFLKRKVYLIACGGTALTLLGIKSSTKDIDFMVPNIDEYVYLVKTLKDLGYRQVTGLGFARDGKFIFDLFCGNKIHTTELLNTPLRDGGNIFYHELNYIYIGILNFYDLMISKLFRGSQVDFDDCVMLVKAKRNEIDMDIFKERFLETALYDVSQDKVIKSMKRFVRIIQRG
ncbi:MAG: hypothetical protein ABH836_07220 [Candidatus Omnitrophota bacterium]